MGITRGYGPDFQPTANMNYSIQKQGADGMLYTASDMTSSFMPGPNTKYRAQKTLGNGSTLEYEVDQNFENPVPLSTQGTSADNKSMTFEDYDKKTYQTVELEDGKTGKILEAGELVEKAGEGEPSFKPGWTRKPLETYVYSEDLTSVVATDPDGNARLSSFDSGKNQMGRTLATGKSEDDQFIAEDVYDYDILPGFVVITTLATTTLATQMVQILEFDEATNAIGKPQRNINTDGRGLVQDFTYNSEGGHTQTVTSRGDTTYFALDSEGKNLKDSQGQDRVEKSVDKWGGVSIFKYDEAGVNTERVDYANQADASPATKKQERFKRFPINSKAPMAPSRFSPKLSIRTGLWSTRIPITFRMPMKREIF